MTSTPAFRTLPQTVTATTASNLGVSRVEGTVDDVRCFS